MTKRCICEICTCGRHRCPHYPQGHSGTKEPCTFSEYASRYIQHPTEPRKDYRPQDKPVASDVGLDDRTTHRVDYVPHALGDRYIRPGEVYQRPQGDIDTMTNYNRDFTQKMADLVRPIRQQEAPKMLGKFEGEPTYQADYRRWEGQTRESMKPGHSYVPSTAPFDSNTHYKTDYVPMQGGPRQILRPNETAHRSDKPFEGSTESQDRYIQHPLQAREQRIGVKYEPNTAPLDDMTTHRKDFTPKDVTKSQNFKPVANPYQSASKFDESTTHKTDYVQWQVEKPAMRDPEAYQRPPGVMDMNTTTNTDYTLKPLERQLYKRPQEAPLSTGKFDDATNYKADYREWGPGEKAAMPQQPTYQPNDAPFEGIPTYQLDYVPKKADPAKSVRPMETTYQSGAPMDGATEYNKEFSHKYIPPCPVPHIEAGHEVGYRYHAHDDGHKFYNFVSNEEYEKFKSGKMYGTLVK